MRAFPDRTIALPTLPEKQEQVIPYLKKLSTTLGEDSRARVSGQIYGIDEVGAANQLIGSDSAGATWEYKTMPVAWATNYASFSAAIAAIGATETTLVISTSLAVSTNETVPSTLALRFERGGELAIADAKTVTINGPLEAGLFKIFSLTGTGKVAFGAGSVEALYPEWWGAIGDSTTADQAAVQLAVNACIASTPSIAMKLSSRYRFSASVNIDRLVNATTDEFRVIGGGKGAGFCATTAINLFSSTIATTVDPKSEFVAFDNVDFYVDTQLTDAYVLNGDKFLRVRFTNCVFEQIKLLTTANYIQSIYVHDCKIRNWAGVFCTSVGSYDVSFQGTLIENGGGVVTSYGGSNVGFRFCDNLSEGLVGLTLQMDGIAGASINGNYLEYNEGTDATAYLDFDAGALKNRGVSLSGNLFVMTTAQNADSAYYAVKWGETYGGVSSGNYCTGNLHKMDEGSDVTVIGDVEAGTTYLRGVRASSARVRGTSGGIVRAFSENVAWFLGGPTPTWTGSFNIPTGSRLLGVQMRVDAALAAGELWDAAYSGGSTTAIVTAGAVASNTKVSVMYDANAASDIVSGTTNIAITKNGGGNFSAQGAIRAIVYYETFDTMVSV